MDDKRLRDAETFVRKALSHFDQPMLSETEIRRVAEKVLRALPTPTKVR